MEKGNSAAFIETKVSISFPEECPTPHPPQRQKHFFSRTYILSFKTAQFWEGKKLLGLIPSSLWMPISHPGLGIVRAPLWALAAPAGPHLCDTNPGKLPGNSTTSPLLLTNFLICTDHTKQLHHSSRNFSLSPRRRVGDTFFPMEGRVGVKVSLL